MRVKRRATVFLLSSIVLIGMFTVVLHAGASFAEPTSKSSSSTDASDSTGGLPSEFAEGGQNGFTWGLDGSGEWNKLAYMDCNMTRIVVGINSEDSAALAELETVAADLDAKIVGNVTMAGRVKAAVVELPLRAVSAFAGRVRVIGLASYVEPNLKIQAQWIPNDPYWHLQWGAKKIEADKAWNTTVGNSSVLVAVVDTGIYHVHPDLALNYAPLGYDWVNMDSDPMDDNGHGTHCAGVIAAALNNSIGIGGIAQVRIMAEKVLGSGGLGYTDGLASGIIHATDQGAKIISMSLGCYSQSQLVYDAIKYAHDAGVLLIAAAGNEDTNIRSYPAGHDEVVAVAATDTGDKKVWFSNWGNWIELAAPGIDILSTVPDGYESCSGTSMAAPHVSGVAALVWSKYPNSTRDWVRMWLRRTADDLGVPGFDIYFGYGRVNARKSVEQTPPVHELMICGWETPPYVEPGTAGVINASVLNFGEEAQDVTVKLLANGTVVHSSSLGLLGCGRSATVSLIWTPTVAGLYDVTVSVAPVPGESDPTNNVVSKTVYVGSPVKAFVLHSSGNVDANSTITWQTLNQEWPQFGGTMIYVDYATLNKEVITYEDIAATGADVLILSCAYDPFAGWQFTNLEIGAIKRYVQEGHGLIATSGTFYYEVPNNCKLAPLFGMNENITWHVTRSDLLNLADLSHPLFANVPNPLSFLKTRGAIPVDGRWDTNELRDGKYLALGRDQESAIVVYRGLVYFSVWMETLPPYYRDHLQLFYNAITWSRYQRPQHELEVSLKCPVHLNPDKKVMINATVKNAGKEVESDVELRLLINEMPVAGLSIPTLAVDETRTTSYEWMPREGRYSVSAYAPPVPGEEDTSNNIQVSGTVVSFGALIGLIGTHGETLHNNRLRGYYLSQGHIVDFIRVQLTPELLSDYDILIVGEESYNIEWDQLEVAAIHDFVRSGKGFAAIGDELSDSVMAILGEYGIKYTGSRGGSGFTSSFNSHRLTESVGNIFASGPTDSLEVASPACWIANDSDNSHILVAATQTQGHVVCMSDDFAADVLRGDNRMMFANMAYWMMIEREHDLTVFSDALTCQEPGRQTLVNATVKNHGLAREANVQLCLLINETLVESVIVPSLATGQSYKFSYPWVPATDGKYNITAYVPPVTGEEYTANNVLTRSVRVQPVKGRVFFDQTHGTDNIAVYACWVDSVEEKGYAVEPHVSGSITLGALAGYDVLVIPQAREVYTSDELAAIRNFVSNGRGLLVVGDENPVIYTSLTSFSGINWTAGGSGGAAVKVAVHEVTEGVSTAYFNAPTTQLCIAPPAIGLIEDQQGNVMLATSLVALGKVLALADEDSVSDRFVEYADNLRLATNVIGWLASRSFKHDLAVRLNAPEYVQMNGSALLQATVTNRGIFNETEVQLFLSVDEVVVDTVAAATLQVGESYTLSYAFTGTSMGLHNVTAFAPPLPTEGYTPNNIMSINVSVFFYTRLSLSHEWKESGLPMDWHGDDASWKYRLPFDFPFFGVSHREIYVSCNGLITFQAPDSNYSNSITALTDKLAIAPAWGDWLSIDPHDIYLWETPDHVGIRWLVGAYGLDSVGNFEAILCSNGTIQFNYGNCGGPVSATSGISDGEGHMFAEDLWSLDRADTVIFLPFYIEGTHDVAVVNLTTDQCRAYTGWTVGMNVTATNLGTAIETFTLTVYCDDAKIWTYNAVNMLPNEVIELSFNWTVREMPYGCNHVVKAFANLTTDEAMENNVCFGELIEIRSTGDLNGDDVVDMKDIGNVCKAFGSYPSRGDWNFWADLNKDGRVDLRDIGMVCVNYGKGMS